MLKHKRGDTVRQITPKPIEGKVVEARIVDDSVSYRVEFPDASGGMSSRWFTEAEIEALDPTPATPEA